MVELYGAGLERAVELAIERAIERAIEEAAPEVTAVEVENLTPEREPQLLQIQPLYTECAVPAAAVGPETGR